MPNLPVIHVYDAKFTSSSCLLHVHVDAFSLCVRVYVCIYVYVCMHIQFHHACMLCVHVCVKYLRTHTFIRQVCCVCMCACMYVCMHTLIHPACICVNMRAPVFMYPCIHILLHYARTFGTKHAHTHTHTYIHIIHTTTGSAQASPIKPSSPSHPHTHALTQAARGGGQKDTDRDAATTSATVNTNTGVLQQYTDDQDACVESETAGSGGGMLDYEADMSDPDWSKAVPDLGFGAVDGRRVIQVRKRRNSMWQGIAYGRGKGLASAVVPVAILMGKALIAVIFWSVSAVFRLRSFSDSLFSRCLAYADEMAQGNVTFSRFTTDIYALVTDMCTTISSGAHTAASTCARICAQHVAEALGRERVMRITRAQRRAAPLGRLALAAFGYVWRHVMVLARYAQRRTIGALISMVKDTTSTAFALTHGSAVAHTQGNNASGVKTQTAFAKFQTSVGQALRRVTQGSMWAHLQELDERLRGLGLQQEDVKGDGNCYYHALVKQLRRNGLRVKRSSGDADSDDKHDDDDGLAAAARAEVCACVCMYVCMYVEI
jgi:hypothetical protein